MTRWSIQRLLAVAAAVLVVGPVASAEAAPASPTTPAEVLARTGAALCRYIDAPETACAALPLAPSVTRAAVTAYASSWEHRALAMQYELGNTVPVANMPWVGTHNSFNSTAEMGPTLSASDSNQQLSLADLLDIDMRTLELDAHLFATPATGGREVPVVCHGEGPSHLGCTSEKTLAQELDVVAAWLRRHPGQVIRLRIEDNLEGAAGQEMARAVIEDKLGSLLYRPPAAATCQVPAATLTRGTIRAAGKQVFLQGDCRGSSPLRSVAFANGPYEEERPIGYREFPVCGNGFKRAEYQAKIIRYYEDSTGLTSGASLAGAATVDDGITPETAARMSRCGIDVVDLDQIVPGDGRHAALVWSWAPGEPSRAGTCTVMSVEDALPFGRFRVRPCTQRHRVACLGRRGRWHVARPPALPQAQARRRCARAGATHTLPRTGYDAQRLRLAMRAARATRAWIAYRRAGEVWRARSAR